MMKRNARQSVSAGFTLVELLVVVSIVALLITIMMPTFGKAKDSARRVASKATVAALDSACEAYAGENSGQYPVSAAATDNKHTVVRHCSYSDGHTPPPPDFTFKSTGVTYPGACLLFDRLARNIDDWTGNPLPTKSKSATYDVGGLKTVQMKHPTAPGVFVDAYYFVDSYDNPILYYNFCLDPVADNMVTSPRYWDEHNTSDTTNNFVRPLAMNVPPTSPLTTPPPPTVAPYSMRWRPLPPFPPPPAPAPGVYEYYRGATKSNNGANFILISPGKDHRYVPADGYVRDIRSPDPSRYWDPNTDDVTNFSVR